MPRVVTLNQSHKKVKTYLFICMRFFIKTNSKDTELLSYTLYENGGMNKNTEKQHTNFMSFA